MKKLKLVFWLIVIGIFGFIGYQNQEYFLAMHSLVIDIDLKFKHYNYQTPEFYNAVSFAACFLLGLLISYFSNLFGQFKANMTIKKLNTSNNNHLEKISKLEKELEKMKTESKGLESNVSSIDEEKPAFESGKADATEPTEDNEQ
jgi:hypothetical protein